MKNILGLSWWLCVSSLCFGANWSQNELHYQLGQLDDVTQNGNSTKTGILTFQHASAWDYGDNFFFLDWIHPENGEDGLHGEFYPNFSGSRILGWSLEGPIKDVGLTLGLDFTTNVNYRKYIPGFRVDWNVPHFTFLNTLVAAYIDDSKGTPFVLPEDDSFIVDTSYSLPFSIKEADFSIQGHIEFVGERTRADGIEKDAWVLSQLQFRYDLGKSLFSRPQQCHIGFEWQYWNNKLSVSSIDENALQALLVWNL